MEVTTDSAPMSGAGADITVDAVHLMALSEAPSSSVSGSLQEHRVTLSFAFLDAAAGFYYVRSCPATCTCVQLVALEPAS